MLNIRFLRDTMQRDMTSRRGYGLCILALILASALGLSLIQPALAALVWQIQTVDSDGYVGADSSLALDSSGNPVISYRDFRYDYLRLVRCGDATCSSGNSIVALDSTVNVAAGTALALDSSDRPVVSYWVTLDNNLKLARCGDVTCSSGNTFVTVDSIGDVGRSSSLALDSNDQPVISYFDATNFDLKLVRCGDATCASGNTIRTLDSAGIVGWYSSLVLDSNNDPVISYYDLTNGDLKLVRCGDATCSSGNTIVTVDSAGDVGAYMSLALDSSGKPVISYFDLTNGDLKLVHCGDATCSSGNTIVTVDSAGTVGGFSSLALDSRGKPVISYFDSINEDLKLVHCGDATCASDNIIQIVESTGQTGRDVSLTLDSRGKPVISYFDLTNFDLKLARLVSDDSTPPVIIPNVVGTLGNNGWYTSDVAVSWSVVDAESVISAQSGCDTTLLTSDTASISLTCTATSSGGAASQNITLKLDKTPPVLSPVVSPNPLVVGGTATVTAGAADALSGIANESCGVLDTSSPGVKSVSCTATDNADSTANATVNYTVEGALIGSCGDYTVYQANSSYIAIGWSGSIKVGTHKGNTLNGTAARDLILGLGGNDKIDGKGGDDLLCGGDGVDLLLGGAGNDLLDGGAGNDVLNGGSGDHDQLLAGEGNDVLLDGDGVINAQGGLGNDLFTLALRNGWRDSNGQTQFAGRLAAGYGNDAVVLVIQDRSPFFVDVTGDERDDPASPLEGDKDGLGLLGHLSPTPVKIKFEKELVISADAAQISDDAGAELLSEAVGDGTDTAAQNNHIFLPVINR